MSYRIELPDDIAAKFGNKYIEDIPDDVTPTQVRDRIMAKVNGTKSPWEKVKSGYQAAQKALTPLEPDEQKKLAQTSPAKANLRAQLGVDDPESPENKGWPITKHVLEAAPYTGVAKAAGIAGKAITGSKVVGPALTRILAGAGQGATQADLEDRDVGVGALGGGLGATAGEIAPGVVTRTAQYLGGASRKAADIGRELAHILPEFDASSWKELFNIANRRGGKEIMDNVFDSAKREVLARIGGGKGAFIQLPSLGGQNLTLDEALALITSKGRSAFNAQGGGKGFAAVDWGKARQELIDKLNRMDMVAFRSKQPGIAGDILDSALEARSGQRGAREILKKGTLAPEQLGPTVTRNIEKLEGKTPAYAPELEDIFTRGAGAPVGPDETQRLRDVLKFWRGSAMQGPRAPYTGIQKAAPVTSGVGASVGANNPDASALPIMALYNWLKNAGRRVYSFGSDEPAYSSRE